VKGDTIPTCVFGQTGHKVTRVGLGGEGVLRTYGKSEQAGEVIREAITQGITYFDSAQAYAGSEGYYGSIWTGSQEMRSRIFQASKSASRHKEDALADLENTLRNMGISYLDLWQIHDVRTEEDLRIISGPGGALEAFLQAKSSGKVRSVGVTGHHDPEILTRAVENWPVDSVMIPVNPVEEILGGFLTSTLPAANKTGIAIIGMKILGASHYLQPRLGITAEVLIRFALSQQISVAIVGCSNASEVKTLADVGRSFNPLSQQERTDLMQRLKPYSRQLAFYRGVL
jgi:aryl-alcohol dehydrogenase-like predicted oxidoreductase